MDDGIYNLKIDEDKCHNCNECTFTCPSYFWTNCNLDDVHSDDWDFEEAWLYKSKDKERLDKSSSGGFITDFVSHIIESHDVYALVTQQKMKDGMFVTEPTIVDNVADVKNAAGSKYVISSVASKINNILQLDKKVIVVGLPCHIRAFKQAEQRHPELRNKILLYISLVCGHATHPAVQISMPIEGDLFDDMIYRKGEWPGHFAIGENVSYNNIMSFPKMWSTYFSHFAFTPEGCLRCPEVLGDGDVVCGDPWNISKEGNTLVLLKTERGRQWFAELMGSQKGIVRPVIKENVSYAYDLNSFHKYTALKQRSGGRTFNPLIFYYNSIVNLMSSYTMNHSYKSIWMFRNMPNFIFNCLSISLVLAKKVSGLFSNNLKQRDE
jgi:coenzyme F420-reducing hydrogenase beta subunit